LWGFRNASPLTLMMATSEIDELQDEILPYRPILDGDEFTRPPLEFFQSIAWNTDKKFLIGFVAEETASFKIGGRISRDVFLVSKVTLLHVPHEIVSYLIIFAITLIFYSKATIKPISRGGH